jgi:hypothetical protein
MDYIEDRERDKTTISSARRGQQVLRDARRDLEVAPHLFLRTIYDKSHGNQRMPVVDHDGVAFRATLPNECLQTPPKSSGEQLSIVE